MGKSIFDVVSGLFLHEEAPIEKGQQEAGDEAPAPKPAAAVLVAPPPAGRKDPELVTKLTARLVGMASEKSTVYAELEDNLQTLADGIPDEGARYKMALKLLAKQGKSPEAIVTEIDKCIGALESGGRIFGDEIAQRSTANVGGLEKRAEQLAAGMKEKVDQIAALQQQVQNDNVEIGRIRIEISREEEKNATAEESFAIAYSGLRKKFQQQRDEVLKHGKA